MKTTFRIKQPYNEIFEACADQFVNISPVRPERFIAKMKNNTGMARAIFGGLDENGLEAKNPLIVALGDSVTAGHFESIITEEVKAAIEMYFGQLDAGARSSQNADLEKLSKPVEIFDARESYIEKFRDLLIDKYELTSVSVINSGIAGDVLPSMIARADRDVIRYDPDLIVINGSLNWNDDRMGDRNVYKEMLRSLIHKFKVETKADIILVTANGDLPNTMVFKEAPIPTTYQRCEAIRELAVEEQVCLADVRAVWDLAKEKGCPWEELLANGINHPSVEGHEVYAKVLMKLFE